MESWPERVKRVRMVLAAPLEEAPRELALQATQRFEQPVKLTRREFVPEVMQLADSHQVSENRPAQARPMRP